MRDVGQPSPAFLIWRSKDMKEEEIDYIELDSFLDDSSDENDGSGGDKGA